MFVPSATSLLVKLTVESVVTPITSVVILTDFAPPKFSPRDVRLALAPVVTALGVVLISDNAPVTIFDVLNVPLTLVTVIRVSAVLTTLPVAPDVAWVTVSPMVKRESIVDISVTAPVVPPVIISPATNLPVAGATNIVLFVVAVIVLAATVWLVAVTLPTENILLASLITIVEEPITTASISPELTVTAEVPPVTLLPVPQAPEFKSTNIVSSLDEPLWTVPVAPVVAWVIVSPTVNVPPVGCVNTDVPLRKVTLSIWVLANVTLDGELWVTSVPVTHVAVPKFWNIVLSALPPTLTIPVALPWVIVEPTVNAVIPLDGCVNSYSSPSTDTIVAVAGVPAASWIAAPTGNEPLVINVWNPSCDWTVPVEPVTIADIVAFSTATVS